MEFVSIVWSEGAGDEDGGGGGGDTPEDEGRGAGVIGWAWVVVDGAGGPACTDWSEIDQDTAMMMNLELPLVPLPCSTDSRVLR
jgi:hypothetical protein